MLIPKKSLGQNFLIDENILKKITNYIKIKNQIVVEIGSGTGQLTKHVLKLNPKKIFLIEKDNNLCKILKKNFNKKNITIYNNDANDINYNRFNRINIISNLPYNISRKIIIKLISEYKNINEMLFMVQKEFADKIDYRNNKKNNKYKFYLEATCNYKQIFNISNKVFYPNPKIKSTLIKIIPKITKINKINLLYFANSVFKNKRKKIKNVLKIENNKNISNEIINKRAEQLTTSQLMLLFDKL